MSTGHSEQHSEESFHHQIEIHPTHDVHPPKSSPTNPIASITSQAQPQPGQHNRSSGNFGTQDAPAGTQKIQWFITENDNFKNIVFNVMKDVPLWTDPVIFRGLRNGDITSYVSERQLYIANPENAGGHTFIVQAWPVISN